LDYIQIPEYGEPGDESRRLTQRDTRAYRTFPTQIIKQPRSIILEWRIRPHDLVAEGSTVLVVERAQYKDAAHSEPANFTTQLYATDLGYIVTAVR